MTSKAIPNKAILILENIWWDLNAPNKGSQTSVLPFFEGLSRLNEDVQIYHMTFTNSSSFKESLDHLLTASQDRLFIYVASHGYGAKLGNSNFSNITAMIAAAVSGDRGRRVEGIIFGACEVGGSAGDTALSKLFGGTGIVWLLAYQKIMEWIPSTLIDLHFINSMMQFENKHLNDRSEIIAHAASTLELFNPNKKIGWTRASDDKNDPADVSVKDSIRLLIKPRGRGQILQDDTATIQNLL